MQHTHGLGPVRTFLNTQHLLSYERPKPPMVAAFETGDDASARRLIEGGHAKSFTINNVDAREYLSHLIDSTKARLGNNCITPEERDMLNGRFYGQLAIMELLPKQRTVGFTRFRHLPTT